MRIEKQAIINEIRENLEQSPFVLVIDYAGMQVAQFHSLRRQLVEHGAGIQVVKNTFFRRAAENMPFAAATEQLAGQVAVVFGGDGIEVTKELQKFIQTNKKPSLQCGVIEGQLFDADELKVLADLPPREVLYGMLAGTLAAPMTQLAGVLHQKAASILYVLKAIEEKKS